MIQKQQKYHPLAPKIVITMLTAVLVIAVYLLYARYNQTSPQTPKTTKPTSVVESKFSFDGTPGWRQGPTNKTSMALFSNTNSCFVSIEHKYGTIDTVTETKKTLEPLDGYTVLPTTSLLQEMQLSTGKKQYTLQQSSVTSPAGQAEMKGGQEFGFIQLPDGYLKIRGHCDTPEELNSTLPALQAIKFEDKP